VIITLPFAVWVMEGFFEEIPIEIEEAALVDGCSRWQTFMRIVLPLSLPGLVEGGWKQRGARHVRQ